MPNWISIKLFFGKIPSEGATLVGIGTNAYRPAEPIVQIPGRTNSWLPNYCDHPPSCANDLFFHEPQPGPMQELPFAAFA